MTDRGMNVDGWRQDDVETDASCGPREAINEAVKEAGWVDGSLNNECKELNECMGESVLSSQAEAESVDGEEEQEGGGVGIQTP
ncbi:hypothetical protein NQ176_g10119 [Zarea fungicola]|uniref:Uncharacterized protein n=1 Tax=Zarea fungicola TaxID=93591 RepID=A0ACC1MIF6_9HYPO|nr:hypothetical protein NQ176_g10119 [Lecanicillium fungicola]